MYFVINKTPQVELDNTNALILALIPTNKKEIVENICYVAIATNDEFEFFQIDRFISAQYMLQAYLGSYGNQSSSGDPCF